VRVSDRRDVQNLLDRFQVSTADVLVLFCRGKVALDNPTNGEIADCLGCNAAIDQTRMRNVVIIGAVLVGMAAAASAALAGLNVLIVETNAPGG